jgi:ABC-2 type transport system permease protein
MNVVWQEILVHTRLALRERQSVFWGFVFPVLLLILFCSIFGGTPERATTLLAGLICINAMSGALFGAGVVLVVAREQGILRRYKVAPIALWKVVVGLCISRVLMISLTTAVLLLVARFFYNAILPSRVAPALIVYLAGTLMFCALAFSVAALSTSAAQANGLSQALFMPMMFLSGATFPQELMPLWMQKASLVLPATYYVTSLKLTIGGSGTGENLTSLLVMGVYSLFAVALSVRFFRWD